MLDALAASFSYRPLFCSEKCIDAILSAVIPSPDDIEKEWGARKARELSAIRERLDAELERARAQEQEQLTKHNASYARERLLYVGGGPGEAFETRRADDERYIKTRAAERIKELKGIADDNVRRLTLEVNQWLKHSLEQHHKTKDQRTAEVLRSFFADYETAKRREHDARQRPQPITDQQRFEHTHVLGPTGSGKTTLIQQLVLSDLEKGDAAPAIVIIDPKGLMVGRIARLKAFHPGGAGSLQKRLIIIDPLHDPAPPLNLFRIAGSPQVVNQAITNFDYIFSQAKSPLTAKMRPVFKFCARLMFSIPDADILTLMDLLESKPDDPRFAPYIQALTDPGAKRFFTRDFYSRNYAETREQIKGRFNEILSMPEIMAMLTSKGQSLDFQQCLQSRSIVLVNTRMAEIGLEASQLLGRYIIALTLSAAFGRVTLAKSMWTPAYLFIDEFQDFVDDEATPRQLRLAREYQLGILCAHQNMFCEELSEALRTAISTNTLIKYCSRPEGADKGYMARDFGCETSFLDQHVKSATHANFACLVKGHPPFTVTVPFGNITPDMQMSDSEYEHVLRANAQRLHPPLVASSSASSSDQRAPAHPQDSNGPQGFFSRSIAKTNLPPSEPSQPPLSRDPGEPSDKW